MCGRNSVADNFKDTTMNVYIYFSHIRYQNANAMSVVAPTFSVQYKNHTEEPVLFELLKLKV